MSQTTGESSTAPLTVATADSRLYAFLLKLRPLQTGTLMPFNGELVHGAFLRWLRVAAPEVATLLHDGNKRRLFTCSSLQWPLPPQRMMQAERENTHMPLDPQKVYTIRLTLLLGDLFPIFHRALMDSHAPDQTAAPPFMQIGKQLFLLEEVVLLPHTSQTSADWTNFVTFTQLVEQAQAAAPKEVSKLVLEFASLTTFSRGNPKTGYGPHQVMVPLPQFVFQNLVKRWEDIAPPELAHVVEKERIEQYLVEDGAIILDYDLKAHHVKFTTHIQRGFVGTCTYQLRGSDAATAATPLTLHQQLFLLAQMGFYSGVGYKTAMGLGQMRLKP